jgi:hypothetical protein
VRTNLELSLALAGQPVGTVAPVAAATRSEPAAATIQAVPSTAEPPPPLAIAPSPVAAVVREVLPPKRVASAGRAPDAPPPLTAQADLSAATASLPATEPDSALPAPDPIFPAFVPPLAADPASPVTAPPDRFAAKPEQADYVKAPQPADPLRAAVEAALDPGASVARHGGMAPAADAAARPMPMTNPGPRQQPDAKPAAAHAPNRWPAAGYFVQIAALNSDKDARAEWQRLRNRLPDLLAGHAPVVQSADVNQRKFWRLRTESFADTASANEFCRRLRAAGSDCWSGSGS